MSARSLPMSSMGRRDVGSRERPAINAAVTEAWPSIAFPTEQKKTRKRPLVPSEDPAEDLVAHIKKCRVSSTPGELRLKKDLAEGDLLCRQGVARFDRTVGSPLECQLTFLCPIGAGGGVQEQQAAAASGGHRRVPTTFSVVVPKFYPHDPPLVYAERCFSRTCPFVRNDGLLQLSFLSPEVWSSISTMSFVAQTLLEGLEKFAKGHPQPWGPPHVNLKAGGRRDPCAEKVENATPDHTGDGGGSRRVGVAVAAGRAVFVSEGSLIEGGYPRVVQAAAGRTVICSNDSRSNSSGGDGGDCWTAVGRRPQQQHGGDSCGGTCRGSPNGMDVSNSL